MEARAKASARAVRPGTRTGVLAALAAIATLLVPAPATASAEEVRADGVDLTCSLALTRLDHTTTNALALDTNAVYWLVPYVGLPGTRLRIEGRFPHARYTGFNVYEPAGAPADAMADVEIEPDAGSVNPYEAGAPRDADERDYTLFVEFGPRPAEPEPNTLYADGSPAGTLWYRVYIPDEGLDAKGGVPLPRITLELTSGGLDLPAIDACRELQAPYLHELTDLIAHDLPAVPVLGATAFPGRNPPSWRLFVNLGKALADIMLDNETGEALHEAAHDLAPDGSGYFANRDISYVFAPTSRAHGEVLVLRGRAPGFADTRPGPLTMPASDETRYWSFCQYEPLTQRVISCLADDRIPVDDEGRFAVVVSHAGERPANAHEGCGFAWLPWGPTTQGLLIYRHLLAAPDFAAAISSIPEPGLERETLGEHYPDGEYMTPAQFDHELGCPAGVSD